MVILVVDDEPAALRKMERTLKKIYSGREDVTILCADNYIDALAFSREKPAIAFLDVEMPEMTGIELAGRLRKVNPRLNIIFVTAYDEFAREAYALHASGYLTKPFVQEDVEGELAQLRYPVEREVSANIPETAVQQNPSAGAVRRLRVQCFGNFEVFSEERPLHFQRRGAKEILAYLISLKGASATRLEISSAMWETAEEIEQKKDYFRILVSALRQTLKKYNAEDVLITSRDSFAVNTQALDCDYYHYLEGDPAAQNQYLGMFMQQYPWAEEMNALLSGQLMDY
ncbi:MAG: response regulator [Lachnospiraceae bacterium]|nr:response regulator [Lachnospiraceae bacterium]